MLSERASTQQDWVVEIKGSRVVEGAMVEPDANPEDKVDFDLDAELAKFRKARRSTTIEAATGKSGRGRSPRDGVLREVEDGRVVVLRPTSVTLDLETIRMLHRVAEAHGQTVSALIRLVGRALYRGDVRLLRDLAFKQESVRED